MNHFPGFPDNWRLRASGGYSSPHPEKDYYRNKEWIAARNAGKVRDWRVNHALNAMGQPIVMRGDILHDIPLRERLARWKQYRAVFPMSRPRLG